MPAKNETAVKQTLDTWAKAVRDGDLEAIMAMHTRDVVMFDVIPPFQIDGLTGFRKTWDSFFEQSPGGDGSFDLSNIKIKANDELAYATAKLLVGKLEVRLTVALENKEGEWLISHEHHSILEEDE
ncbi:MAG: nuclear transport factor 2 family protein [Flavitalea sp.]